MKNQGSLTIFDIMDRRKRLAKRILAVFLILVVVVSTCFYSGITKNEVEAAGETPEPEEYITYVMKEIRKDPDRKFIILEVVADEQAAEFPYYAPAKYDINLDGSQKDGILTKTSYMTQLEIDDTDDWRNLPGGEVNTYHHPEALFVINPQNANQRDKATASLMSFRTFYNGFSKKYSITVENSFLEVVVPEYYAELKDRLEVHVIEANDLTVEDIDSADLIYIHSNGTDQGGAVALNRLVSRMTGKGEDGTTNNRVASTVVPTYTKSGSNFTANNEPGGYLFSEYEFVANGSDEDIRYKAVLEQYKDDPEKLSYVTYDTVDATVGGVAGYYKSRDMNWLCVEELWKLSLTGRYFPLDNAYADLPIIIDHTGSQGTGSNADKAITFIETCGTAPIDMLGDGTQTILPYEILHQCVQTGIEKDASGNITTDLKFYTSTGMRTGAFSYLNYEPIRNGSLYDIFGGTGKFYNGETKTPLEDGAVIPALHWGTYCKNMLYYWSDQGMKLNETGESLSQRNLLIDAIRRDTRYNFSGWSTDSHTFVSALYNDDGYGGLQNCLRDNFMTYAHTSAMVPQSRHSTVNGIDGYADRYGNESQYLYKMIRWILGAGGGGSHFDPHPNTNETMTFNLLEIEPCNDFRFKKTAEVAGLLKRMSGGTEYTYNSSTGLYEVSGSATATKYKVNVDAYTVNAFDGLTTDLIAEYDFIYMGIGSSNFNGKKGIVYPDPNNIYWTQEVKYLYYGGDDSTNANDITDVKYQELLDYVSVGKVLLLHYQLSLNAEDTSLLYQFLTDSTEYSNVIATDGPQYNGKYSEQNAAVEYNPYVTPSIKNLQVKDTSGNALPIKGDELTYGSDGIINSLVDEGFAVTGDFTNCIPDTDYCIQLIIDEDNDGIFGEERSEYKFSQVINTALTDSAMVEDEDTGLVSFNYTFSVSLPTAYVSDMINWKIGIYEAATADSEQILEFPSSIDKTAVLEADKIHRDTYVGFVPLIKSSADKEAVCNVLHITENDGDKLSADSAFISLLEKAETALNYNVTVTSLNPKNSTDTAKLTAGEIAKGDYQMVIVGTGTYSALSDVLKAEIQKWVTDDNYQSKRILFMNDTDKAVGTFGLTLDQLGQKDGTKTTYNEKSTGEIGVLNDGQINQYPYNIDNDGVTVNAMNPDTYQLMLDFVNATAQTTKGIVVWNTLTSSTSSNEFYVDYKDAINNYFTYSMGNVCYTAMGSCSTEMDRKLMVNIIIGAISKSQYREPPAIIVNNGVMTAGGYNIYVDLEEILEAAERSAAEADALRAEAYVIDFTATNYDNGDMDGWMYWYKTPGDETSAVLLYDYLGTNRLKSGEMREENLTSLVGMADYAEFIAQIEAEQADIVIKAKNDDNQTAEKHVKFRQRSMYNLK